MKTVVLVDDERSVVESISKLVKWEQYGVKLVATCLNGFEALEAVKKNSPDIVITDIKMPVMNGLELIHRIKEASEKTEFIILSGYGEFEYAKEAMKEGVKYYLLKPFGEKDITEAIQASLREIERRVETEANKKKSRMTQMELIRQTVLAVLQEGFGNSIQNNMLHSLLDERNLILIGFSHMPSETESGRLFQSYQSIEMKDLTYVPLLVQIQKSLFGFYLSPYPILPEEKLNQLCESVTEVFGEIPHLLVNKKGYMESLQKDITDICGDYINFCYSLGAEWLYRKRSGQNFYGSISKYVDNLGQCLLDNNQNEMKSQIKRMLNENSRETATYVLVNFFIKYSSQGNIRFEQIHSLFETLREESDSERFVQEVIKLIDQLNTQEGQDFVDGIVQYIEKHLADETLNLKWIARELVFLNEDYVGKKFTQKTGINFTAYLNSRRIEKAKVLLVTEKAASNEKIAKSVGYGNNPQYFQKTFKKYTGYTPKEFKKNAKKYEK